MNRTFQTSVSISHFLLKQYISSGDVVVDATCGNGNDTVFLAELVGATGKVYGFDIQKAAIANTSIRLREANLMDRVKLINTGHEFMAEHINRKCKAVVFNLGYLPKGDHEIITTSTTTLTALQECLKLVVTGGIIILVVYLGHSGGLDEANAVLDYTRKLPKQQWDVMHIKHINRGETSPQLILMEKII